jgi:hypothetical protein
LPMVMDVMVDIDSDPAKLKRQQWTVSDPDCCNLP